MDKMLLVWQAAFQKISAQCKTPIGSTDKPCCHCGSTVEVLLESSRTAYCWDGKGKDPNAPMPLCRECAKEHHAYWDDMWSNVSHY